MNSIRNHLFFLTAFFYVVGCSTQKSSNSNDTTNVQQESGSDDFLAYNSSFIQYEGRVPKESGYAGLYWSGTTIRINFRGTGVKALMEDQKGQNYYNVLVDGNVLYRLKMDTGKKWYPVVEHLIEGKHLLELFKITQAHKEYGRGYTKFYGLQLNKGATVLQPPPLKKRKMEFYGNSVTCGHAIEDTTGGDSGASKFENNFLSYAAFTARHYNAQYSCIAKSGIGMMVSWSPAIMPEMFDRENPYDSTSRWDFSRYIPDIVVINLFQNDQGILERPDFKEFKRRFGDTPPSEAFIISSYQNFLKQIRSKYPKANIICTLGSMAATQEGSPWPGYVEKAVVRMHDSKIFTHFFAYKGSPGHPRVKDHQVMAESLIQFIDSHIKW